jgi:hypothetical protein
MSAELYPDLHNAPTQVAAQLAWSIGEDQLVGFADDEHPDQEAGRHHSWSSVWLIAAAVLFCTGATALIISFLSWEWHLVLWVVALLSVPQWLLAGMGAAVEAVIVWAWRQRVAP